MYRERAAGMYSELPFASAQCLIEVPYNLVQAFLFSLISYFMLGFDHDAGESSSLLSVLCSSEKTLIISMKCFSVWDGHRKGCWLLRMQSCPLACKHLGSRGQAHSQPACQLSGFTPC
jgi:hypothetical protein